ncbi:hypothetical protein LTS18_003726, partial [Coniosporium uncinatum]
KRNPMTNDESARPNSDGTKTDTAGYGSSKRSSLPASIVKNGEKEPRDAPRKSSQRNSTARSSTPTSSRPLSTRTKPSPMSSSKRYSSSSNQTSTLNRTCDVRDGSPTKGKRPRATPSSTRTRASTLEADIAPRRSRADLFEDSQKSTSSRQAPGSSKLSSRDTPTRPKKEPKLPPSAHDRHDAAQKAPPPKRSSSLRRAYQKIVGHSASDKQVDKQNASPTTTEELERLREELKELQQSLNEANQIIMQQDEDLKAVQPLMEQKKTMEELMVSDIMSEIRTARQKERDDVLAACHREYQAKLEPMQQEHEARTAALKRQLDAYRGETERMKGDLDRQIRLLEHELAIATADQAATLRDLDDRGSSRDDELSALREELGAAQDECRRLQAELHEALKSIDELKRSLEQREIARAAHDDDEIRPATPPTPAMAVKMNATFQRDMAEALENAMQENERLADELAGVKAAKQHAETQVAASSSSLGMLQAELNGKNHELGESAKEKAELEGALAAAEARSAEYEQVSVISKEAENAIQTKHDKVVKRLTDLEAAYVAKVAELDELSKKHDELASREVESDATIAAKDAEIAEQKGKHVELADKLTAAEAAVASKAEELDKLSKERDDLISKATETDVALLAKDTQIAELTTKLDDHLLSLTTLETALAAKDSELADLTNQKQDLETTHTTTHQELEDLTRKHEALDAASAANEAELSNLRAERADLLAEVAKTDTARAEKDNKTAALVARREELETAARTAAAANAQTEEDLVAAMKDLEAARTETGELTDRLEKMSTEHETARSALVAAQEELAHHVAAVAAAAAEGDDTRRRLREVEEALAAARHAHEDIAQGNEAAKKELENAWARVAQHTAELEELAKAKAQLEEANGRIEKLVEDAKGYEVERSELLAAKERVEQYEQDIQNLKKECEDARTQLDALKAAADESEQASETELAEARARIETAAAELAGLKAEQDAAQARIEALSKEVESHDAVAAELKQATELAEQRARELKDLTTAHSTAKAQIEHLYTDLATHQSATAALEQAQTHIEDLKQQLITLDTTQADLTKVREEVERLSHDADEYAATKTQLEMARAQLRQLAEDLEGYTRVRGELEEALIRIADLERDVEEGGRIGAELEEARKRVEELGDQVEAGKAEVEVSRQRIEEVQHELDAANVERRKALEGMEALKEEAETRAAALEGEKVGLSKELDTARRTIEDNQNTAHEVLEAMAEVENEINAAKDAQNEAQQQISGLSAEKTRLAEELDAAHKTMGERDSAAREGMNGMATVEKELHVARDAQAESQRQVDGLLAEKEKLSEELAAARHSLEEHVNAAREVSDGMTAVERELQAARDSQAESEQQVADLTAEKEQLAKDLGAARKTIEDNDATARTVLDRMGEVGKELQTAQGSQAESEQWTARLMANKAVLAREPEAARLAAQETDKRLKALEAASNLDSERFTDREPESTKKSVDGEGQAERLAATEVAREAADELLDRRNHSAEEPGTEPMREAQMKPITSQPMWTEPDLEQDSEPENIDRIVDGGPETPLMETDRRVNHNGEQAREALGVENTSLPPAAVDAPPDSETAAITESNVEAREIDPASPHAEQTGDGDAETNLLPSPSAESRKREEEPIEPLEEEQEPTQPAEKPDTSHEGDLKDKSNHKALSEAGEPSEVAEATEPTKEGEQDEAPSAGESGAKAHSPAVHPSTESPVKTDSTTAPIGSEKDKASSSHTEAAKESWDNEQLNAPRRDQHADEEPSSSTPSPNPSHERAVAGESDELPSADAGEQGTEEPVSVEDPEADGGVQARVATFERLAREHDAAPRSEEGKAQPGVDEREGGEHLDVEDGDQDRSDHGSGGDVEHKQGPESEGERASPSQPAGGEQIQGEKVAKSSNETQEPLSERIGENLTMSLAADESEPREDEGLPGARQVSAPEDEVSEDLRKHPKPDEQPSQHEKEEKTPAKYSARSSPMLLKHEPVHDVVQGHKDDLEDHVQSQNQEAAPSDEGQNNATPIEESMQGLPNDALRSDGNVNDTRYPGQDEDQDSGIREEHAPSREEAAPRQGSQEATEKEDALSENMPQTPSQDKPVGRDVETPEQSTASGQETDPVSSKDSNTEPESSSGSVALNENGEVSSIEPPHYNDQKEQPKQSIEELPGPRSESSPTSSATDERGDTSEEVSASPHVKKSQVDPPTPVEAPEDDRSSLSSLEESATPEHRTPPREDGHQRADPASPSPSPTEHGGGSPKPTKSVEGPSGEDPDTEAHPHSADAGAASPESENSSEVENSPHKDPNTEPQDGNNPIEANRNEVTDKAAEPKKDSTEDNGSKAAEFDVSAQHSVPEDLNIPPHEPAEKEAPGSEDSGERKEQRTAAKEDQTLVGTPPHVAADTDKDYEPEASARSEAEPVHVAEDGVPQPEAEEETRAPDRGGLSNQELQQSSDEALMSMGKDAPDEWPTSSGPKSDHTRQVLMNTNEGDDYKLAPKSDIPPVPLAKPEGPANNKDSEEERQTAVDKASQQYTSDRDTSLAPVSVETSPDQEHSVPGGLAPDITPSQWLVEDDIHSSDNVPGQSGQVSPGPPAQEHRIDSLRDSRADAGQDDLATRAGLPPATQGTETAPSSQNQDWNASGDGEAVRDPNDREEASGSATDDRAKPEPTMTDQDEPSTQPHSQQSQHDDPNRGDFSDAQIGHTDSHRPPDHPPHTPDERESDHANENGIAQQPGPQRLDENAHRRMDDTDLAEANEDHPSGNTSKALDSDDDGPEVQQVGSIPESSNLSDHNETGTTSSGSRQRSADEHPAAGDFDQVEPSGRSSDHKEDSPDSDWVPPISEPNKADDEKPENEKLLTPSSPDFGGEKIADAEVTDDARSGPSLGPTAEDTPHDDALEHDDTPEHDNTSERDGIPEHEDSAEHNEDILKERKDQAGEWPLASPAHQQKSLDPRENANDRVVAEDTDSDLTHTPRTPSDQDFADLSDNEASDAAHESPHAVQNNNTGTERLPERPFTPPTDERSQSFDDDDDDDQRDEAHDEPASSRDASQIEDADQSRSSSPDPPPKRASTPSGESRSPNLENNGHGEAQDEPSSPPQAPREDDHARSPSPDSSSPNDVDVRTEDTPRETPMATPYDYPGAFPMTPADGLATPLGQSGGGSGMGGPSFFDRAGGIASGALHAAQHAVGLDRPPREGRGQEIRVGNDGSHLGDEAGATGQRG